jgi:hypothetical protein
VRQTRPEAKSCAKCKINDKRRKTFLASGETALDHVLTVMCGWFDKNPRDCEKTTMKESLP